MSENGNQRVAVVTGATSGIGLACAKILAENGYSTYICGRDQDRLDATIKELKEAGLDVDGSTCDVTKAEDIKKFVQAAVDRYGPIDVLVNNAGRSGGGLVAEHSDELWFDIINTNLNSVYLMTKEVLNVGGMLARKQGHVINIASTSGKQGIAAGSAYSASKHGVVGFSKSRRLRARKVRHHRQCRLPRLRGDTARRARPGILRAAARDDAAGGPRLVQRTNPIGEIHDS